VYGSSKSASVACSDLDDYEVTVRLTATFAEFTDDHCGALRVQETVGASYALCTWAERERERDKGGTWVARLSLRSSVMWKAPHHLRFAF